MTLRIQLITDSSAQLPEEIARELGILVVSAVIELDGLSFREGVDMDATAFYERLRPGSALSTSQPSPGDFVDVVESAAAAGAEEVVAILVGSAYSGTVQSARLASSLTTIPLHVVDSSTASFGIACCVIEAGRVLRAGGSVEEASSAAQAMGSEVQSVFVLQGLELAERSGRFQLLNQVGSQDSSAGSEPSRGTEPSTGTVAAAEDGILVLWACGGAVEVVATVYRVEDAVEAMANRVFSSGRVMNVASSLAAPEMADMTNQLNEVLSASHLVSDLVHYRVGPSVAAQTGPGTAGVFYYPECAS